MYFFTADLFVAKIFVNAMPSVITERGRCAGYTNAAQVKMSELNSAYYHTAEVMLVAFLDITKFVV